MMTTLMLFTGLFFPGEVSLDDLAAQNPLPQGIWLESLDLSAMDQEWGSAGAARSVDGTPLRIGGRTFPHGVGSHANAELTLDLKGAARFFHAAVGVDDEVGERGTVVFAILVDDEEVARTEVMRGGEPAKILSVDLAGARQLTLLVEEGGDNINYDHANWAGAMLVLDPSVAAKPVTRRAPDDPVPDIIHEPRAEPEIHAPRITGATPGAPFLFRIPATGRGPLRFSTRDLPDGLHLDPASGILTGALRAEGRHQVSITVEGTAGSATSKLTIVGGSHQLALTPPMGWNSWNVWGTAVDDEKVRAAADWMVKSGLADHGYQYINIDDAWEGKRDEEGRLQPNEKFPDMSSLVDYVHSKGLKLGIYSSPGPHTCAGYPGSYQHEEIDAVTWAEWGIDLIKYDWCSYGQIAKDSSLEELQKPYRVMRRALDLCGRDIVYSICQYGMGDVSRWGADVGGNYWRTTYDITDSWSSMSSLGFGQSGLEEYAGPGHWNDPDMLVVGQVGWGPSLHPTKLTKNEQITHLTLWSLLAAPLLVGCDLTQIDDFTFAVLTNPEVLAVNQDPLGVQAKRVAQEGESEVWMRPLEGGTWAVGLFNRGRKMTEITVDWKTLGLTGPQPVRNLWLRQDEGGFDGSYRTTVPRHGAVMLKIG